MEAVLQVPWKFIVSDLPVFSVLAVWNLLVLLVLSKKVYEFTVNYHSSKDWVASEFIPLSTESESLVLRQQ